MDRLQTVTLSPGGRPIPRVNLADPTGLTVYTERSTFNIAPPTKTQNWSRATRRFGGSVQSGESHDNWTALASWWIKGGGNPNQVLANAEQLMAEIDDPTGLHPQAPKLLEWRPDGATQSGFFDLRGTGLYNPRYDWAAFAGAQMLKLDLSWPIGPLQLGLPMDISDPLDVDSRTDYTIDVGPNLAYNPPIGGQGTGRLFAAGGYTQSSGEIRARHTARGYPYGDVQVTVAVSIGTTVPASIGVCSSYIDANNYLLATYNGTTLQIYKSDARTLTQLASVSAPAMPTARTVWIRIREEGNQVTAELFGTLGTQPTPLGTPDATVSVALSGSDILKYGSGGTGSTGFRLVQPPADTAITYFEAMPYTYRNHLLPDSFEIPRVPGTASPIFDLQVSSGGIPVGPPHTASAALAVGTGGTFPAAGNYRYAITTVTPAGESTPIRLDVNVAATTNQYQITIGALQNASSYNIYRTVGIVATGGSGGEELLFNAPASLGAPNNITVVDAGAAPFSTRTPPTIDTSYPGTPQFGLAAWTRAPLNHNRVWNGDFELDVDGWTANAGLGNSAAASIARGTVQPDSGIGHATITTAATTFSGAMFTIARRLRAGKTIFFSARLASPNMTDPATVRLSGSNGVLGQTFTASSNSPAMKATYQTYYGYAVIPFDLDYVQLAIVRNAATVGGTIYADQVTVCDLSLSSATYLSTVLADNPVGYWRLGEPIGTGRIAIDQTGSLSPNLIGNPSFEAADLAGWTVSTTGLVSTISGFYADNTWSNQGAYSGRLTAFSLANLQTVTAQTPVQLTGPGSYSFAAQINVRTRTNSNIVLQANWQDSAGNPLGSNQSTVIATTGPFRLTFTATAPAGATQATLALIVTALATGAAIDVNFDAIMAVAGALPLTYYAGNGGNDGDYQGSFYPNLIGQPLDSTSISSWSTTAPGFWLAAGSSIVAQASPPAPPYGANWLQITTTATLHEGIAYPLPGTYTAGQPYTFSVYLKGNAGGESIQIALGAAGADAVNTNLILTTGWVRYSITWTPTANETAAYAVLRTNAASAYVFTANAAQVTATPNQLVFSDNVSNGTAASAVLLDSSLAHAFDQRGSVAIPNNPALQLNTGTVEIWAQTANSTGIQTLIEKSGAYGLYIDGGNFAFFDWTTSTYTIATPFVADGGWHHYAVTFAHGITNGTQMFIDGIATGNAFTWHGGGQTNGLTINSPGSGLLGSLDEAAVYNTILTPAQIQQHYQQGAGLYTLPSLPTQQNGRGANPPFGILDGAGIKPGDTVAVNCTVTQTPSNGGSLSALARSISILTTAATAGSATVDWWIDPHLLAQSDDFARGTIAIEIYWRGSCPPSVPSTNGDNWIQNPRIVISAISDPAFGSVIERFTQEFGTLGRQLQQANVGTTQPSTGRMSRLGTLLLPVNPSAPARWKLKATHVWSAANTQNTGYQTALATDYLLLAPIRRRAAGPTGKNRLDGSYPVWQSQPPGVQTRKTIRTGLSGRVAIPSALPIIDVEDSGLGGSNLELQPPPALLSGYGLIEQNHSLLLKLSSLVPDDPSAEQGETVQHPATVHLAVTPRYRFTRGN